jgi:hypothetical protein
MSPALRARPLLEDADLCRRHVKTDPLTALPSGGQFSAAVDNLPASRPRRRRGALPHIAEPTSHASGLPRRRRVFD